ncbi:Zn(2)-C6 fungal-type domain-containing protein [Plasmodiophora brassicae]|uniref:Zn(2)-C6 fungal-type domain-containing protein n=1 Tax=Plasmodiophora brassicae TaxID=37360 RepID=A0A0G4J0U8_PLABS|nr:hypothetical protein PBRA_001849 [Plasmodiophora brassicae]SPR01282.1 unnamed protein product [Plasmodiophora brassicae]
MVAEVGKRLTSCALCARVHARCDGGRPCGRCARLRERECHDQDPASRPKRIGKISRIAGACSQCVRGKARCQRERPCARCCRLGKAYDCVREVEPEPSSCLIEITPISYAIEVPNEIRMYTLNGHRYCNPTLIQRLTDVERQRYCMSIRRLLTDDLIQVVERELAPGVVYPLLSPPVYVGDEPPEFPLSLLTDGTPSLVISVVTGKRTCFKAMSINDAATKLFGYTSADFNRCNKMLCTLTDKFVLSQIWMITHPSYWPTLACIVTHCLLLNHNTMYFPQWGILCKDGSCRTTQAHCLIQCLPRPRSCAASDSYVSMRFIFVFRELPAEPRAYSRHMLPAPSS